MRLHLLLLLLLAVASPSLAATLTVNTTTDELNTDGDCSLREAVQAANTDTAVDACAAGSGADTIQIPAGTYLLTRTGVAEDANATGDLDVTQSVTFARTGMGTVTLDGNGTDRVMHVLSGTVTASDLGFANGHAPDAATGNGAAGGAILNAGTLTLTDCTFTGNTGGRGGDSMNIAGNGGNGGAISSSGTLTLMRCRFSSNTGGGGGNSTGIGPSAFAGSGGEGGAVASTGTLSATGCTFTSNVGGTGGTSMTFAGSGGLGGGVGARGAASSTLVVDSTFTGNSGGPGSGLFSHGGGIAQTQGTLTVRSSTFSGNTGQLGGGVFLSVGTGTVLNSTFIGNVSSLRGAGVFTEGSPLQVSSSTVFANRGGGLAAQGGGTLTVKGSINAGNRNPADTGYLDCEVLSGTVASGGQNIFGVGTACTAVASDQSIAPATVAMAVVAPVLASNGGPTQTLALVAAGPAVDRGSCTDVAGTTVAVDQRGAPRPATGCDVGAVESNFLAPVVLRIVAEPAGMNCAGGGQRLQTGRDDGRGGGIALDGVLQDGEVDSTQYVCNGMGGTSALVSTTTLTSGDPNCAAGGVKLEVGADDDRDGMLDANEVDSTSYVCNGAAGAAGPAGMTGDAGAPGADGRTALLKVTALGRGDSHCAAGGVQIDTGVDDDRDGALAAGEIDSTAYVCNGADGAAGEAGAPGPKGGCQSVPGLAVVVALLALVRPRRR